MSWKNDRAEMEMREAGKKMMEDAANKKKAEEKAQVGQWKITVKASPDHTKEDVEGFIDQLVQFTKDCDEKNPRIEMSVDPIIEITE